MTALCSGGTSSAKAGFAATVALTVPAIGALLNNVPTVYAVPFAALLGLLNYQLSTFCTVDPPSLPTLTAQDFVDLLQFIDIGAHLAAQLKLNQFVNYYAWFNFCTCDSIPTPAPTPGQAAPTGMPAINPPQVGPSYPSGTPCQTYTFSGTGATNTNFPTSGTAPIGGATACVITVNPNKQNLANPLTYRFVAEFRNGSGTVVGSASAVYSSAAPTNNSPFSIPATATQFDFAIFNTGGFDSTFTWQAVFDLYCGTTPGGSGGPVPTPCVTDPLTQLTLQSILELVTLIQRQSVPFAYIASTVHAGLSGNGLISVQGRIGMLVHITSTPSNVGQELGDPNVVFNAGWVNWGSADGVSPREWLSAISQLSLPTAAGAYTTFQYSLSPGVVVTLTELQREP